MKLRHIILSLVTVLAIAASCGDDSLRVLSEVRVSSSYVAIPVGGGSTTITVDAVSDWTISGAPTWLTISPSSGAAGQTSVTFSAASALDGRTGTVSLACDGAVQEINVIQGLSTVAKATCAEVIAGADSKTYLVSGVCTAIANTSYGNFYLNDGTGSIYIYGLVDASGAYNWSKFDIEVGDEVTVQGPKTTYYGTVELVDASFISVSKSLVKIESVNYGETGEIDAEGNPVMRETIVSEGGDVAVTLSNKAGGLYTEVPEDAASWLSIKSIAGNTIIFHASENVSGPRTATLTFKAEADGKEYTAETSVTQDGAIGSKDLPMNVAEAIAFGKTLSGSSAQDFYVKGTVSKILYTFSASYGTATFWISDDGLFNGAENGKSTADTDHDFECYSIYYFDNNKWTDGNAQIAVGAEVVVCGRLTQYNGTAETASKAAYVYSINGVGDDAEGIGTLDDMFTPKGAVAAAAATPSSNVYISGKIASIVSNGSFSSKYGNASFWMSADGSYTGDKSVEFEAYRVLYLGNRKWVEGDTQIAVGDDVVIYGPLTTYNGTSETVSGKGYIVSLNGKTE